MAQRAESLNVERKHQSPAPVVQFPIKGQRASAEDNLARLRKLARESYRSMHDRAARSYSAIVDRRNDLAKRLKGQIHSTREEHPLRIVAVAAGTAFILGIVLRVWRNQHE